MYGADWCGDCKRAELFFDKFDIDYNYIDVDADEDASKKVIEINKGSRSIPTIIVELQNGEQIILVEPSWDKLSEVFLA